MGNRGLGVIEYIVLLLMAIILVLILGEQITAFATSVGEMIIPEEKESFEVSPDDRFSKAQDIVLEKTDIEYVTAVYETPDFVQINGKAGKGYVCYRVYDDGRIIER